MTRKGFVVTEQTMILIGDLESHEYPLLPGDLLTKDDITNVFCKVYPGFAIVGFSLTEKQQETLIPVKFTQTGLNFHITGLNFHILSGLDQE